MHSYYKPYVLLGTLRGIRYVVDQRGAGAPHFFSLRGNWQQWQQSIYFQARGASSSTGVRSEKTIQATESNRETEKA